MYSLKLSMARRTSAFVTFSAAGASKSTVSSMFLVTVAAPTASVTPTNV
jgi:hypothetical protein